MTIMYDNEVLSYEECDVTLDGYMPKNDERNVTHDFVSRKLLLKCMALVVFAMRRFRNKIMNLEQSRRARVLSCSDSYPLDPSLQ